MRSTWIALAVTASLVAAADAVQLLILDWTPKSYGAIGGALLYVGIGIGAWAERRAAAWAAALIPILPVSILVATAAGVELPVRPDAAMVGILGLQLVAAALGIRTLVGP